MASLASVYNYKYSPLDGMPWMHYFNQLGAIPIMKAGTFQRYAFPGRVLIGQGVQSYVQVWKSGKEMYMIGDWLSFAQDGHDFWPNYFGLRLNWIIRV